jgi:hypothetical protein
MIGFINRIGQHSQASMFNVPAAGSDELVEYKKRIKR